VVLSVLEVWVGVSLGLLLASNVALWIKLDGCYSTLSELIREKGKIIEKQVDMTEIKEEIVHTVEDFMNNLHVPTGIDHAWGAVSQMAMLWAQKRFGGLPGMIPPPEEQQI